MPDHDDARPDTRHARASWDRAADAYANGHAIGRDYYRYEFFGPAQVALCGEVAGLRVLDVGCGSGYFAREMASRGARVEAIDLSPRMIAHAVRIEQARPLGIAYRVLDAERLDEAFDEGAFDLVTSCLALQDVPRPDGALLAMRRVLRPGGRVVASITHPCTDTPFREWRRAADGSKLALCVDRYFERGPLECHWSGWGVDFTTPAVHAPLADWFAWILAAGFALRGFHEPRPTDDAVRARPDLEDAARVPYYAMFDLVAW
jgi:2-polyprenyl-3-methyl-5-hydroxy-6-metoxy-1,4-benzoquinol methylase